MKKTIKGKKAQVWVETVIYTLIGLAIIAIILAIATPAIERYKDQLVVEQTTSVMNDLGITIKDVRDAGSGNKRLVPELMIKKGKIEIDPENEQISYILEKTRLQYSEPGIPLKQGGIEINTEQIGASKYYNLTLALNYQDTINITYNGKDIKETLTAAATPYQLTIQHNGTSISPNPLGGPDIVRIWIDIEEV